MKGFNYKNIRRKRKIDKILNRASDTEHEDIFNHIQKI